MIERDDCEQVQIYFGRDVTMTRKWQENAGIQCRHLITGMQRGDLERVRKLLDGRWNILLEKEENICP